MTSLAFGPITLGHYLSLGAILFALSVIGIFLNRRNLIVFFILTVAAAESAIGLAILVVLFRNRATINVDELDTLKG